MCEEWKKRKENTKMCSRQESNPRHFSVPSNSTFCHSSPATTVHSHHTLTQHKSYFVRCTRYSYVRQQLFRQYQYMCFPNYTHIFLIVLRCDSYDKMELSHSTLSKNLKRGQVVTKRIFSCVSHRNTTNTAKLQIHRLGNITASLSTANCPRHQQGSVCTSSGFTKQQVELSHYCCVGPVH